MEKIKETRLELNHLQEAMEKGDYELVQKLIDEKWLVEDGEDGDAVLKLKKYDHR